MPFPQRHWFLSLLQQCCGALYTGCSCRLGMLNCAHSVSVKVRSGGGLEKIRWRSSSFLTKTVASMVAFSPVHLRPGEHERRDVADGTLEPPSLSPTVETPDPSPERGRPRDRQNHADQLHVPPADQDWGMWVPDVQREKCVVSELMVLCQRLFEWLIWSDCKSEVLTE